jgi:hypothetical protein
MKIGERLNSLRPLICAHFYSGMVALLVFIGSLFHYSAKQQFINTWEQYKTMYKQIKCYAPDLEDDTHVTIFTNQFNSLGLEVGKYTEISDFLYVLYNNKSIKGNLGNRLRFYQNKIESIDWEPKYIYQVSYDNLILFKFDGKTLQMIPKMEVEAQDGERIIVKNNPNRIFRQATLSQSDVWRHLIK